MESLKFILICDRLVEFVADFKSQPENSHNSFTLAVVKEEIRDIWADIKNSYSKFMESTLLVEVKVPKTEVEAVKSKYRSCFKLYTTCISAIGQIGVQFEEVTVQKTEASGSRGFHVPPCDMEVFSGDYLKWPSFRDLFTAVYVKNSSLSKVEKLFHLNSKTSGDAKEIVSKAPLTNEGFDVAWSNLVQRFENKRILVNSQLRILFNMPPISTESGYKRSSKHDQQFYFSPKITQSGCYKLGLHSVLPVFHKTSNVHSFFVGVSRIRPKFQHDLISIHF